MSRRRPSRIAARAAGEAEAAKSENTVKRGGR
jgi:hypothetical protein